MLILCHFSGEAHVLRALHTGVNTSHVYATVQVTVTSILLKERFSFECRKTKTKVITLTNYNTRKQRNEPISISLKRVYFPIISKICLFLQARCTRITQEIPIVSFIYFPFELTFENSRFGFKVPSFSTL